ncbi:hypothetical protein V6N11_036889 [Hibiscus sabdariffa]|uniref:Uncharacterized protein n=1 Tax=Hibiscus sabdariffa TaxID=183260 RepID=A0ABR2RBQ8_9ROSI
MNGADTRGMTGGDAESEQEGANLSNSVEHSSSRLDDDEHAGSQQSLGDTGLGRTTNMLDGSSQSGEMAAETTNDNEGFDLDVSNDLGGATSALSNHKDAVSGNEGGCVNETFDETRVEAETSTEAGLEAESADEENTIGVDKEPVTVQQALSVPEWKEAVLAELGALQKNNT